MTEEELYQRERLKDYLMTQAEKIIWQRRMRKRHQKLDLINFKFLSQEFNFDEKNNYIEFNIENCAHYFNAQKKTHEETRKEKEMQQLKH